MAFNLPAIKIPIEAIDKFSQQMEGPMKKIGAMGKKMQSAGKTMTMGLTLPIAAFGVSAVKTAADFESSMLRVGAVSRANDDQLARLTKRARELGATTQFSASQAADAMGFLAMAGFSVEDNMKALPGVLDLAAAGQMDLATTADIASNILTGYGKDAKDLTAVNDIMVATFTRTNTNLEQLGQAMKFVAPVASAMKIPIEETSAAIGLLGNAGIQASMAGTTLRGALSRLAKPSGEAIAAFNQLGIRKQDILDSEGNVKSLVDVVRVLEKSGANAGQMMAIFGQRAGPGMSALVQQGSKALADMTKTLEDAAGAGGAAEVAQKQMSGFNGKMLTLKSAFQEMQIAIAESGLLDFVGRLTEKLTGLFRWIGQLNPEILKWVTIFGAVAAAIGPVLLVLGTMLTMLPGLVAGIKMVGVALSFLAANPIGMVVMAVAGLIALLVIAIKHWDTTVKVLKWVWGWVSKLAVLFFRFMTPLGLLIEAIKFIRGGSGGESPAPEAGESEVANNIAAAQAGGNKDGTVNVRFENAPAGTRAEAEGENMAIDTELGLLPTGAG